MPVLIDSVALRCRVPEGLAADHRRARAFLDRLLGAVRGDLAQALSRALAGLDDDLRVVFLERIDFEVAVNIDRPPEEIAQRIAGQLSRKIWTRLADPATPDFSDLVELWARFLLDVAMGAAFTRSWHAEFDGFRALPPSAIIRSVIETDPPRAFEALGRLTITDLHRVCGALKLTDARRALATSLAVAMQPCREPNRISEALASIGNLRAGNPRRELALVAVLKRMGTDADAVTIELARHLDTAEAVPWGGHATRESQSTRGAPSGQRDLASEARPAARPSAVPQAAPSAWHVSLGGAWLLLPWIQDRLQAIEDPANAAAVALAAVSVAAAGNAETIWFDSRWRDGFGLPDGTDTRAASGLAELCLARDASRFASPPTPVGRPFTLRKSDLLELRAAAARLAFAPEQARMLARLAYAALRSYARRLMGFAGSGNAHLWRNFLSTPASVTVEPERIGVELEVPLLDLVWRISGGGTACFRLPDGREVRVGVRR